MNITNLILQLKSKLNDDTLDQQMISKAIKLLEVGAVESVGSFSDLPLPNENVGRIYYVERDGLYYSIDGYWVPIVRTSANVLWSWGFYTRSNLRGNSLGNNTAFFSMSPVSVVGGFADWCQIKSGTFHSLAIRSNGTLWTWGNNCFGVLGDGTTINRSSPVSVLGGFTDWCQVNGDICHSLALRSNGTLWSWGINNTGQLGDGTTISRSSPVSVIGGITDWCRVSTNNSHSLAIRSNGTLWSWGNNRFLSNATGQLGDGNGISRSSPVSVVGGFTDWCQVSASRYRTLAIRSNGTLWSWGIGTNGDGTNISRSSPVSVVGGFTDWCQVTASISHSLALRSNGTLWSWGSGSQGVLGDGTVITRSSPVSVLGGFTDWCQVSVGNTHNFALRSNGTLWSWGRNCFFSGATLITNSGYLGDGTTINRSSPVSVVGGITDWCCVLTNLIAYCSGNIDSSCDLGSGIRTFGLRTNGTIWGWGNNRNGQLGNNSRENASSPVSVIGGFTDWSSLSLSPHKLTAIRKIEL
jgi:alpha-tubulin suppressor-like RCC1 family protein